MKRKLFSGAVLILALCSCNSTKISVNDIEVKRKFAQEIAVLQNQDYPINSREKYKAAMTIYDKIDLSYARSVDKLYEIFSPYDARFSSSDTATANILFRYDYQDKFVRFLFYTYNGRITRFDSDTDETLAERQKQSDGRGSPVTSSNVVNPIPSSSSPAQ